MIIIDSKIQTLNFKNKTYFISTAKNGLGEKENSFKTPRGKFKIVAKIGKDCPKNTIFISRKATNIYQGEATDKDLILSRILWLGGLEDFNKNTQNRYIYIHGTNHEKDIGKACSHGCIRMKNDDVIELFDKINMIQNLTIIIK